MKGPKKYKLIHRINIHDIIRRCTVCGGSGRVRNQDGFGAFGEPTFCVEGCRKCAGKGFTIYSEKNIKKALQKIRNIERKNNEAQVKFYGDI
jgi:DnaJ-class molecular chaperone